MSHVHAVAHYHLAPGQSPGVSFAYAAHPKSLSSGGIFAASTTEVGDTYEPIPGSQSPAEGVAGSFTFEDGGDYVFKRQPGFTGTVTIGIRYRDVSEGVTVEFTFPLDVTDSTPAAPSFSGPVADQTATVGQAFTLDVGALFTGATAYTVQASQLPAGLALDLNTGVISGTPTDADDDRTGIVVRGSNTGGNADSNAFSITVQPAPVAGTGQLTAGGLTVTPILTATLQVAA